MKTANTQPFFNNGYKVVLENRTLPFRGGKYRYIHHCYEEKTTSERFTTLDLDWKNMNQVYNQYRVDKQIPFTDEICSLRKGFDLSSTAMAKLLGVKISEYKRYEEGLVPALETGKLLKKLVQTPELIIERINNNPNIVSEKIRNKVIARVTKLKENRGRNEMLHYLVFGNARRDKFNGYAPQSVEMVHNCLHFFVNELSDTYITKMNKLLFYADFLSYKRFGFGLTGLSYNAIQYGPVPCNWDKVYSAFDDDIYLDPVEFPNGEEGEKIVSRATYDYKTMFSDEQLSLLNDICNIFGNMSSKKISETSHKEKAWIENVATKSPIDYTYAFELIGI